LSAMHFQFHDFTPTVLSLSPLISPLTPPSSLSLSLSLSPFFLSPFLPPPLPLSHWGCSEYGSGWGLLCSQQGSGVCVCVVWCVCVCVCVCWKCWAVMAH